MKNDKYIKLETGQVINYGNKPKELKEDDFKSSEEKRLFSIFSGGDGTFDKKDYDNLWNLAEEFAKKNGNEDVLDDDERQKMLDELVNTEKTQEKIYNYSFKDFLIKVFQKQDKIVLKDTADLNIDFHEMKEKSVINSIGKDKEKLSDIAIAEKFFNPDNLEYKTEYYNESSNIKTKTILGSNGEPVRTILFDEDGTVNSVEIKTEFGYQIIDFKNQQSGGYAIKNTSRDKTVKSETDYLSGQKYKELIYDKEDGLKFEHTYHLSFDNNETNYLTATTEYKNGKKHKRTSYNSEGIIKGRLEFVYDSDWHSVYPSELLSYDGRGNLIRRIDNKTNKEYDGNGNEIKEDKSKPDKKSWNYWEKDIEELTNNFTTENLSKLLQKGSVADVIEWYGVNNSYFEDSQLIERPLIDRILNNSNDRARKEQVAILVEAIRHEIDGAVNQNYCLKDTLLQQGKNKLNKLLDDCLVSNTDSAKIKSNVETVLYMFKNNFYEFNGFAYTDKPNGKYDQYAYQNHIGDCWLLASFDALSELDGGHDYVNSHIENNPEKQEITIKLMGGKIEYTFTYEEIDKAYGFSVGEPDAKAIEMAYDKYFKEYKPEGDDSIDGNSMKNAYWILSGNEPKDAVIQNGKAGVIIDGEFIEISKNNRDKLKNIPIDIKNITPEIMAQIKEIQDFTAKTTISLDEHGLSSHAFYITDISEDNNITVKEPNNPTNSRTYTQEYYNKVYNNEMTIFII